MTFFNGRRDRLDAFRLGSRCTLTEVFQAYVDDVSQLLRQGFRLDARQLIVRGIGDAEREKELVQEVFLRAFAPKARRAYNPLLPYRPYLLQISRNLLIDEWRARGLPLAEVTSAELEAAPALEMPVDDALEEGKLRAATSAWCHTLPAALREFLRLRFEGGLSQADVAAQLRVSRRQVRTMEAQLQQGLKAHLSSLGLLEG
jgi:RNA polymerase sigma factor (sigma-70 family)